MDAITLESGLVTSVTDLDLTHGQVALNTKVNTSMIEDMVTVNSITMMDQSMKVLGHMIFVKEWESLHGLMEVSILAHLLQIK